MGEIRLDVARRQAFGPGFTITSRDESMAATLCQGTLTMPPHPAWRLPENPRWDEDPFRDSNWQFQYHSLRWLDPLRRRAEAGDASAAKEWKKFARSWIEANPQGGAVSPWAWVDMGDALRTMTLTFALPMVQDEEWLLESLVEHGLWLLDEKNLGRANHSLHQHQALFVLGKVLKVDHWADIAVQRLRALLLVSYDEEGVNEEGSIAYHENNYHWWKIALKRLSAEGEDLPPEAARIDLALDELAHATRPDGAYERIGDTDGGGPTRLSSPAVDYVNSKGVRGVEPAERVKVYQRGYIFGRSGWGRGSRAFSDETFYSVSFDRADRVHGHQDGGSLTLHAQGRSWLIDSGKFVYGNHPMRSYVLGRAGHNVMVIRDRKYDRSSRVHLVRQNLSSMADDFALIDNGYHGVELSRRITYLRGIDCVIVMDSVRADGRVEASQLWHLGSDLSAQLGATVCSVVAGKRGLKMEWLGSSPELSAVRGSVDPYEGWTSTGWKKKSPSTVVKAIQEGEQMDFCTVMSLGGLNSSCEIVDGDLAANITIRIRQEGVSHTVQFFDERVVVS